LSISSAGPEAGSTRRFVITQGWLLLAAAASLLYPLGRFLGFAVPRQPRYFVVPRLLMTGGFLVETDFILFQGTDRAWAVSRICTHLGCRLAYRQQEDLLICPCHQSCFTPAGQRVAGPARRDLPVYAVERKGQDGGNGGGYIVTLT